jgi:GT2 family glycosyltransferase
MRISTILLNWNREPLLEKCIQSYAATIISPSQPVVKDNASGDDSREVVERFCAELPYLNRIFLSQNLGRGHLKLSLTP